MHKLRLHPCKLKQIYPEHLYKCSYTAVHKESSLSNSMSAAPASAVIYWVISGFCSAEMCSRRKCCLQSSQLGVLGFWRCALRSREVVSFHLLRWVHFFVKTGVCIWGILSLRVLLLKNIYFQAAFCEPNCRIDVCISILAMFKSKGIMSVQAFPALFKSSLAGEVTCNSKTGVWLSGFSVLDREAFSWLQRIIRSFPTELG